MRILTALKNEKINKELKEKYHYDIVSSDVQYLDGIFETMEKIKDCDLLIISYKIINKNNLEKTINKIISKKYFKRIILISKNKIKLKNKKIEIINKKNISSKIINNKIKKINNKINLKYIIKNKIIKKNKIIIKNKYIISFIGTSKVGKTILIILITKIIKNKNILIISNDIEKNIKNKKIKIINNIKEKIHENDIENILNEKYNYIFIDGINLFNENIQKIIMEKSNKCILLIEPNINELSNIRKLLNNYINKMKIKKEKINIIFNKINFYSVDCEILNNLFSDFKIIGKIKYSKLFNLIINSNYNILPIIIKNNIKKIILKVED